MLPRPKWPFPLPSELLLRHRFPPQPQAPPPTPYSSTPTPAWGEASAQPGLIPKHPWPELPKAVFSSFKRHLFSRQRHRRRLQNLSPCLGSINLTSTCSTWSLSPGFYHGPREPGAEVWALCDTVTGADIIDATPQPASCTWFSLFSHVYYAYLLLTEYLDDFADIF